MKRLREAIRGFVAKHIVAYDPGPELSLLDREDLISHGRWEPEGLGL
ncbi:hypothetical protein [Arthrobacter alpinus]|nr:hypothetical protein [Arthrobacter alpinus]